MLEREARGEIMILRLNRPERLNAWSGELRDLLRRTLDELDGDPAVRAVVLTGTGDRAFCAGADLSDASIGLSEAAEERMVAFKAFYRAIQSFRKPLVAALNGLAVGSAMQAILLMDYRVGHRGVRLGLPEINAGMPCITGSAILSWSIGATLARNIATTGRFVGAEEAERLGMIEELVEPGQVLERAIAVASELAQKSPGAFAETKLWFRDMAAPALDAAFAHAAAVRGREEMAEAIQAGVKSFFKKA